MARIEVGCVRSEPKFVWPESEMASFCRNCSAGTPARAHGDDGAARLGTCGDGGRRKHDAQGQWSYSQHETEHIMNVSFFWQSAKEMCLEESAFGRHRERRSRVAIQPLLATAAGLTAGLLRSTRNDVLKPRFRQRRRRASSSGEDGRLDLSRTADDFKRLKGWCARVE